jgi:hypothetical protein
VRRFVHEEGENAMIWIAARQQRNTERMTNVIMGPESSRRRLTDSTQPLVYVFSGLKMFFVARFDNTSAHNNNKK